MGCCSDESKEIYKTCSKCGRELPLSQFYFRKNRNRHHGQCKTCYQEKNREWRKNNWEKYLESCRKYCRKNPEKVAVWQRRASRKYYQKNRERELDRGKRYYRENPEAREARNRRGRIFRLLNPEYQRNWYERNRGRIRKKESFRKKTDPKYRLKCNMRALIRLSLKNQSKNRRKWESLVGYTVEDLKKHLEGLFGNGMGWDNYGEWHIDHIIPVVAFNFTDPSHVDFKLCWALKNLRPMWAAENIRKGCRLFNPFQPSLPISI